MSEVAIDSFHSKLGRIKIITDEPTLEDALDFKNYSSRLADIIKGSTPRFSIGVFGGWGTGKTSLMKMIKQILDMNDKIVTVWFDAWKYEREEYLAVIPFLRTVKLTLDKASQKSNAGNLDIVKNAVEKTGSVFSALIKSSKVSSGIPGVISVDTDFGKASDVLKGDGSIGNDKNTIYYHVTDFLQKGLDELRKKDKDYRIVVFIDDLDRCSPEKALEVLESIKSFFDVEGFVYVIGMDSETINSLIKKKYGEETAIKGLDYLQKIVQLPFQIPTWKEIDISSSIGKIISKGLEGSTWLVSEFENNKEIIVKAVQLNPREVKRFINNIILAKAVFGKPIDELIVVQALNFRSEWNKFLELITPDEKRRNFLNEYKKLKAEGHVITTKEELDKIFNEEKVESNAAVFKDIIEVYKELLNQNNYALRSFLDAGALEILLRIGKMEEHRRALETTEHRRTQLDVSKMVRAYWDQSRELTEERTIGGRGKVILASIAADVFEKERSNYRHTESDEPHTHGAFSIHLIEGLDGKAEDPDTGLITLGSLRRYIENQMKAEGTEGPLYSAIEATEVESVKIATIKEQKKQEIQGSRQAIIIGANTYGSVDFASLAGAENDAREVFGRLEKHGNFSISPNHFLLGPDATRGKILKAIGEVLNRKDVNYDLVIFYFSGHGMFDENNEGYIAPYDIDPKDPYVNGISMTDLKNYISKSENKASIIIILDCDYSGIVTKGIR